MKHEGSDKHFKVQATPAPAGSAQIWTSVQDPGSQSLFSKLLVLAGFLLLVAVMADPVVREMAQSLDPSVRTVLQAVTRIGNSAWPLGAGLILLGLLELLRRSNQPVRPEDLEPCRAVLIFLMASVAISGVLASLAKHMIGRIRPSTGPDPMVLDFAFMVFKSGWAAFPSGHATTATAAAVALALCFPRQSWGFLAVGCVAALSRALLGVHWLTDCLAGMILGAVLTVAIYRRMIAWGFPLEIPAASLSNIAASTLGMLQQFATRAMRRNP